MNDSAVVAPDVRRLAREAVSLGDRYGDRYGDLFDGALLAIYVSRPDGRLISCNTSFAQMLGFPSIADAIGAGVSTIYADEHERARFLSRVRREGRLEHYRSRLRRRDDDVIDVIETVVGQFDAAGELVELCGFLIDVTASVEAEAALVERARPFHAVFLDAADAMLILDDDRAIVEANPAACSLFGVAGAELVGLPLDDLIAEGKDELVPAWRELLALGETKREHRVQTMRGSTRLVECSYRARVHGNRHLAASPMTSTICSPRFSDTPSS